MKSLVLWLAVLVLFLSATITASSATGLEEEISYGQGRFGALYMLCGSGLQKKLVGGSLAEWRKETTRGFMGSTQEHAKLVKAFNAAVAVVKADPRACKNWGRRAARTWGLVARLAKYGAPTSTD